MSGDPIFVRTRHNYDSYTDWWTLVEASEFPTCYVDQIDLRDPSKLYILSPMNGEIQHHLDWSLGRKCAILHWNLERPGEQKISKFTEDNQHWIDAGIIDQVIVSDRKLASDTGFNYAPVGGHSALGEPGTLKLWDFVHLMAYSYSRSQTGLYNYLTPKLDFHGMKIAPNGWGEKRHNVLQTSRYMLNVHQDTHRYMEPLRFVLAAVYGLPIVTEECYDPFPYEPLIQFSKSRIVEAMREAVNCYSSVDARYQRVLMTEQMTFRRCVERFL